jgi:hypothetical protein
MKIILTIDIKDGPDTLIELIKILQAVGDLSRRGSGRFATSSTNLSRPAQIGPFVHTIRGEARLGWGNRVRRLGNARGRLGRRPRF